MRVLRVHTVPCRPPCWRISLNNQLRFDSQDSSLHMLKSSQPLCSQFSDKTMWGVTKMGIPGVLIHLFIEVSIVTHPDIVVTHLRNPPYKETTNQWRNLHHSQDFRGHPPNCESALQASPVPFLQAWAHPDETSWWERQCQDMQSQPCKWLLNPSCHMLKRPKCVSSRWIPSLTGPYSSSSCNPTRSKRFNKTQIRNPFILPYKLHSLNPLHQLHDKNQVLCI